MFFQMDFEGKFEVERMSRLEREGRILKQLADHEQDVSSDFDAERVSLGQVPVQLCTGQPTFESADF